MKFGKYYASKVKEFKQNECLSYKFHKKTIKYITKHFIRDIESLNFVIIDDIEDYIILPCCICLEKIETRQEVFNMSCCNNFIHPCCFIKTMLHSKGCPLCRTNLENILLKEKFSLNRYILQLLSSLLINIENIETKYKQLNLKNSFTISFAMLNTIALLKILKKIDKKLLINITKHFINLFMSQKSFFIDGKNYIKQNKNFQYLYFRLFT